MNQEPVARRRREFLFGTVAAFTAPALVSSWAMAPDGPIVETANGKLRGARQDGIVSFKGVQYAADTGGRNRFMAPQPVASWAGVRDALQFGDRCPQPVRGNPPASTGNQPGSSENCCVLNVYTPGLDPAARRPVMLFIHGGGFSSGSGDPPALDGTNLAKFGDVVVLSVNHRLNVFGYTGLGHLDPDFADAANVGQLDLIAALRWVKENIHAFGGDPQRVTLFGESGGGAKIATLSVMPAAKGLFLRTINMSGPGGFFLKPSATAERVTNEQLKALGIERGNLRKLQEIPAEQLLAAHVKTLASLKADQFRPTIDGRHIFHAPMSTEGAAMQASLPGIISSTATEAMPWLLRDRRHLQVTAEQVKAKIQAQFGLDEAKAAAALAGYQHDDANRSAWDILVAITSDAMIRTPMRRAAEARARAGAEPVYLCDFVWKSPVDGGIWGGPHAVDIPFAFGNLEAHRLTAGTGPGAIEASRNLMSAYVAFARSGSPNNPRMPQWKPYELAARPSMVIDESCQLVNDYRSGDRRASDLFPLQETFQVTNGPLVNYPT
jgi:para-nitrobenzyl esterase